MKVAVALTVLSFLGLAYAAGTKNLYDKCNDDEDCKAKLECRAIWSDCSGQKQCVCKHDADYRDQVYISTQGDCFDKVRFGKYCDHNEECAYAFGECSANKCGCQIGEVCKKNKENGEVCNIDDDCGYLDPVEWEYHTGKCRDKECGCPDKMDEDGVKCNRRRGPKTKNQGCRVNNYVESMQCAKDLSCRRCYNGGPEKCRSGQGMIHASLVVVVAMLGISLLKM